MAKISKNIRRLRNERGLTQEALAEKLNVTRQTVSSWETDRTRPDIDLLEAISAALNADIEELIYGKPRVSRPDEEKEKSKKTITVVISVVGSLLVAVGLIILFADFWGDVPEAVKGALAFLPLLAGAGAACYVFFKKKNSAVWREGASVMWIGGLAATNALINSLFSADLGFENLMLIDAVLVAPMMFVLDSVVPLVVSALLSAIGFAVSDGSALSFIALAAVLAACLAFTAADKTRRGFTQWVSFVALGADIIIVAFMLTPAEITVLLLLFAVFLAGCAADGSKPVCAPLRFAALPGVLAAGTVYAAGYSSVYFSSDYESRAYELYLIRSASELIPLFAAVLLLCAVSVFFIFNQKEKNKLKLAFIVTGCVYAVCASAFIFFDKPEFKSVALLLISAVLGGITTAFGLKKSKLLTVNLGLVDICADAYIIIFALEPEAWVIGLTFVILGAALLLLNRFLIKKFSAERAGEESGVNDNA